MKTAPLRVLYVHHNSDLYGSSRSLIRLLQNLDRKKFIPIVALAEDGPLRQKLESLGVEIIFHPRLSVITRPVLKSWRLIFFLLNFPLAAWQLRGLIKNKKINLVHTNSGVIVSSGLAAKLAGVPHVWHMREWFQEFGALWPLYARYILWLSKKVFCISASVASQFPAGDKMVVIHNGFDLREFAVPKEKLREEFRAKFNLGNEFVVGCVGRIKLVRKGQEFLIQAAALLKERGCKARYLLVGAPYAGNEDHLVEMKRLVSELKLEDDIIFTGELLDTRPAYAAMDVSILPSAQPEPLGGVVMESMSMSVPIIATNIGGPVEMIVDGETGFLVPPSDPKALADKIECLIKNADLRKRFAEAGPKHVEQNFALEKMARKVEGVYETIVG